MKIRKGILAGIAATTVMACSNNDSPTQPAAPAAPTGPVTYNIAVTVQSESLQGIAEALLKILDGKFAGQTFTTGSDGKITLTGAEGSMSIEASADGYSNRTRKVDPPATTGATQSVTFTLPLRSNVFGAGQYLVGIDIDAGRYFSVPMSGCYWERQSGLSGTLSDVIANEFIGFDSAQEIVAILSTDVAFEPDGECGLWFKTRRHNLQSEVRPGRWLVNTQITPGTYRVTASSGCYWERLRDFTHELGGIIANDFVPDAGQQLVTIESSDLGFFGDADCGTWTRVNGVQADTSRLRESGAGAQSWAEIERNRELNRRQEGR